MQAEVIQALNQAGIANIPMLLHTGTTSAGQKFFISAPQGIAVQFSHNVLRIVRDVATIIRDMYLAQVGRAATEQHRGYTLLMHARAEVHRHIRWIDRVTLQRPRQQH
jgi:hypothetical protein